MSYDEIKGLHIIVYGIWAIEVYILSLYRARLSYRALARTGRCWGKTLSYQEKSIK